MKVWKLKKIALPPSVTDVLKENQRGRATPLNFSISGVKIGVHNWSHGLQEKSGKYLSPENAMNAYVLKFLDYNDSNRPQGEQDVIGLMITASHSDEFIAKIENIATLLPEPTFKQALDYAKASATIDQTKMIKTPAMASPAFAKEADITPQSARTLQSVLRNATAIATTSVANNINDVINALKQKKAERERENQQKTERLLSATAQAYAFIDRGELAEVAMNLKRNLPDAGNIFTACVMFIGKDLSNLKGMIYEL